MDCFLLIAIPCCMISMAGCIFKLGQYHGWSLTMDAYFACKLPAGEFDHQKFFDKVVQQ